MSHDEAELRKALDLLETWLARQPALPEDTPDDPQRAIARQHLQLMRDEANKLRMQLLMLRRR